MINPQLSFFWAPPAYNEGIVARTYFRSQERRKELADGSPWTEADLDFYAGSKIAVFTDNDGLDGREAYVVGRLLAHACRFYSNGWDVVIECYSLRELAEMIRETGVPLDANLGELITAFAENEGLEIRCDYGNDILAAGGLATTEFKLGV